MRSRLGVALAALALGCGPGEAPAPPSPPVAERPAAAADAPAAGEPLAAGELRVEGRDGRFTLEANGVPVDRVLTELSTAADIALEPGAPLASERLITARIADATLVDVLSLVLRETDFSLALRFEPSLQRHTTVLRIGPTVAAGDGALAAALFELLDSEDSEVVVAALEAIERAGDPSAVPEVEPLVDDEDATVREAAETTLDVLLQGEPLAADDVP